MKRTKISSNLIKNLQLMYSGFTGSLWEKPLMKWPVMHSF